MTRPLDTRLHQLRVDQPALLLMLATSSSTSYLTLPVLLDPAKVVFIVLGGLAETEVLLLLDTLLLRAEHLLLMVYQVQQRVRVRLVLGCVVLVAQWKVR